MSNTDPRNSKANVLINKNGHARLTDFGLVSVAPGNQSVVSLLEDSPVIGATWAAPEISKGGAVTREGDVFAFAMVAAEVRTRGHFEKNLLAHSPRIDVHRTFRIRRILSCCVDRGTPSTTGNDECGFMESHAEMLESRSTEAANYL